MESYSAVSATTSAPTTSTFRTKRKREDNDVIETRIKNPEACTAQLYSEQFYDAEPRLLAVLKECQQHIRISCQAVYGFCKEPGTLRCGAMNPYGYGEFESLCVGNAGAVGVGKSQHGEPRVSMKAFIEKLESETFDPSEQRFAFRAKVQIDPVPHAWTVKSVQLVFAHPAPAVTMEYFPEDGNCTYYGSATLRTDDQQIFQKLTCQVTMLIPALLLLRVQLRGMRSSTGVGFSNLPLDENAGEDAVTLTNGEFSIKVARDVLKSLSAVTSVIFAKKTVGTVYVYGVSLSREAVVAVIRAAIDKVDTFPLDPCTVTPLFLYELLTLTTVWDVPPLKLWSQMAFLERLCGPQFDLDSVPIADAVDCIWNNYCSNQAYTAARFLLAGISVVLRCTHTSQSLRILGTLLQRNHDLRRMIEAVVGPGTSMQIFVRGPDREFTVLNVDPWFTIGEIKTMLQGRLHKPAGYIPYMRLNYGMRLVCEHDERTLADWNIQNMSTLSINISWGAYRAVKRAD